MLTLTQEETTMEEIVRIRYSNPEQEKSLCLNLLQWEELHHDVYVRAFAHTYLGDYYVSINDNHQSIFHLTIARDISLEHDYNDLLVRIYSLLGYYYNSIADDQSALEYYIEGITVCHQVKDAASEGLILNNIGYRLQCRHGYQQALKFYQEAYEIFQTCEEPSPILGILLNNLATVYTLLDKLDEAKQYIIACEEECLGSDQYDIFRSQNWCQYYVAKNEPDKAIYWADFIISQEREITENNNYAFDIYLLLFDSMTQLHNEKYANKFLLLMKKYAAANTIEQRQELETRRMMFCITFDHDEAAQRSAYKRYAVQIQELDDIRNITITNGLKDAIRLLHVNKQKDQLNNEKDHLDHQVNVDELTKVYTRHYLDILMDKYKQQPLDTLGFIMMDLDCLKEYNDTYGHADGDHALRCIGTLLNRYKQEGIYPCRFGGDEFVCLCVNCNNDNIEKYIQNIRKDLHDKHIPHKASRCAKQVTLSIGYSNEQKGKNMQEVFELADQALYRSKLNGRNTYCKLNISHDT